MTDLDEERARQMIKEVDERRKKDADDTRLKRRSTDRMTKRPGHFHATVMCFVSKDDNGNFKDMQHNEVMGLSVDACIRKGLNRSEDRQDQYHLTQLSECHESHPTSTLED